MIFHYEYIILRPYYITILLEKNNSNKMAHHPNSQSVTVTADTISTAIVDTICGLTLTNRICDLPEQRRK